MTDNPIITPDDEIKTLTVDSEQEKIEWIALLKTAVDFHEQCAQACKPTIIGADETAYKIHNAWGRAILETIWLIEQWTVESEGPAG